MLESSVLVGLRPDAGEVHAAAMRQLSSMAMVSNPCDARRLLEAWRQIPVPVRAILEDELSETGYDGRPAIELRCSSILMATTRQSDPVHGWSRSLTIMARVLMRVRRVIAPRTSGHVVAFIRGLSDFAVAKGLDDLEMSRFDLEEVAAGFRVHPQECHLLDMSKFPQHEFDEWLKARRTTL